MRAIGIGLMIFNLLLTAAIGFYLAPASWAKRQELNATVAKMYLVKRGLPLEAPKFDSSASTQPISFETAGGHFVPDVSTELMTGLFNGADAPVNSQKEALDLAYNKLQTTVTGMNSATEVIELLAGKFVQGRLNPGILTQMSRTYEERKAVRDLIPAPNSKPDNNQLNAAANKAKDILKARYEEVLAAKTDLEKKDRISHFLAHLEPQSNTWQKRVILVVGMVQYTRMLGNQSAAFDEISRRVTRSIEQDQNAYVVEYETLKKLAIERAQIAAAQKLVEIELAENKADDQSSLSAREGQRDARIQERDKINADRKTILEQNAALELKLQATQRKVGLLLDSILSEEAKLEAAERKLSGGK